MKINVKVVFYIILALAIIFILCSIFMLVRGLINEAQLRY